jgi:hypothetical protein
MLAFGGVIEVSRSVGPLGVEGDGAAASKAALKVFNMINPFCSTSAIDESTRKDS